MYFYKILYYLNELIFRFIYIFYSFILIIFILFLKIKQILFLLLYPVIYVTGITNYIYTSFEELIYIYIKIIFTIGLIFIIPYLFYNLYCFVLCSLYYYEVFYFWIKA